MARILNEEEYRIKRTEILEAARRLVLTKGYDQMSIQDLLDELKISKGAFYHYFQSKQALLEGLIDRMQQEGLSVLTPVLADPDLPAIQKLERYYQSGAAWKSQYKQEIFQILRIWYADENTLIRQKMFTHSVQRIAPLIAQVVRQGIREGSFQTAHPDQAAEFIILLLQSLGDAYASAMLNPAGENEQDHREHGWQKIKIMFEAYTEALERLLGAAPGSVHLMDVNLLKDWLV